MTPYDILNRWAEYANVHSAQYLAHQSCDHLQKIREYDPNGLFSVMYAKLKFIQICNECTLKFIPYSQGARLLKRRARDLGYVPFGRSSADGRVFAR